METMSKAEGDAVFAEHMTFTESIQKSGHLVAGDALMPVNTATTIRMRNGKLSTTDGPFAETKEQLGGHYLIEAKDLNEAIQVASRIPAVRTGSKEIRPVMVFAPTVGDMGAEVAPERAREVVEAIHRADSRRVLVTLIRLLGDFDLAEEALRDAFAAAIERWPVEGVPARPVPWLVSAGRFRAIDAIRRRARFDASQAEIADRLGSPAEPVEDEVADDRLRLVFTAVIQPSRRTRRLPSPSGKSAG